MHNASLNSRPVVLTFTRWYLPGYKAGGPVRTMSNMVDRLGGELDFRIVTQDRDMSDQAAYPGIDMADWNSLGHSCVRYLSRQHITLRSLARIIREVAPDVLYLNSFFDPLFTQRVLLLRRFGKIADVPVVLAPRGEFSEGALALKKMKKDIYLRMARWLGVYDGLTWQASSDLEKQDILRRLPQIDSSRVKLALDIPTPNAVIDGSAGNWKPGGQFKVCFLSRVSPMKNLDFALTCLRDVKAHVMLTIYGPIEDLKYWEQCEAQIADLPTNVQVNYVGELAHQEVAHALSQHGLFFLPTRGENYGHVIQEALTAGLPVLISDQTPWRDLEQHCVGWALPLGDPSAFAKIIDTVASWSAEMTEAARARAKAYAQNKASDMDVVHANLELFRLVQAKR